MVETMNDWGTMVRKTTVWEIICVNELGEENNFKTIRGNKAIDELDNEAIDIVSEIQ